MPLRAAHKIKAPGFTGGYLLTGGGSGIGEATCKLLAQAGSAVVVSDIDLVSAQTTAYAILDSGDEASAVQHDVTNIQDWVRGFQLTPKFQTLWVY